MTINLAQCWRLPRHQARDRRCPPPGRALVPRHQPGQRRPGRGVVPPARLDRAVLQGHASPASASPACRSPAPVASAACSPPSPCALAWLALLALPEAATSRPAGAPTSPPGAAPAPPPSPSNTSTTPTTPTVPTDSGYASGAVGGLWVSLSRRNFGWGHQAGFKRQSSIPPASRLGLADCLLQTGESPQPRRAHIGRERQVEVAQGDAARLVEGREGNPELGRGEHGQWPVARASFTSITPISRWRICATSRCGSSRRAKRRIQIGPLPVGERRGWTARVPGHHGRRVALERATRRSGTRARYRRRG